MAGVRGGDPQAGSIERTVLLLLLGASVLPVAVAAAVEHRSGRELVERGARPQAAGGTAEAEVGPGRGASGEGRS
jgi:hypothetical protein